MNILEAKPSWGLGKLCEAQVSFFLNLSSSAFAMFVLRSLYLDLWRRKQSEGGFDKPEEFIDSANKGVEVC